MTFDRRRSIGLMPQVVPCGQCASCRLERSRQWALRIMHEASEHERNCFLTLTYDDDLAPGRVAPVSLQKDHLQKFFKRCRKAGLRFRYYACGEYGDELGRPHFHVCMFGEDFSDEIFPWPFLRSLWKHGNVDVAQLEFESAAYVARYCMKKWTTAKQELLLEDGLLPHYSVVDETTGELHFIAPEFSVMSRGNASHKGQGCGIGASYFRRFLPEIERDDSVIAQRRTGNFECKPPRYYDQLLERCAPASFERVKRKRRKLARKISDRELEAKRVILDVKLGNQRRSYES